VTLLSICQQVANSVGFTQPTAIFGNSDPTAVQMLAASQDEGEALARRPQGGWTQMIREYVFTTFSISNLTCNVTEGSATVSNILPNTTGILPGFYLTANGLLNNSVVNVVTDANDVTLVSPYTGQGNYTNTALTTSHTDYALPSDFERMIDNTLWDRTRFWAMRGALNPQDWQLFKSSVIGQASIQRRWRIRYINGVDTFCIDPVPVDNGSYMVFEYVSNAWCQSATGTYQTQWMADTDTGVIDEYLIRLGVKWRMLERLGLNYASALEEYQRAVDKAVAQDGGAAILDMTPNERLTLIGPWNLPESGFGGIIG